MTDSAAQSREDAIAVATHHALFPCDFVRDAFGVEPTVHQAAMLNAIANPGSHVTVRSGHGVGKTSCLAWLVLWFLCFRDDCKIPCTAPSSHQLFDLLWAEIAKWRGKMIPFYGRHIDVRSDRVFIIGHDKTRFAVARTARKEAPEALQGFHATNLLFLIDEASGVEDPVFEVAEGALSTPGARVLMAGNPTRTDGYFYDSHNRNRESWIPLHFSSGDSVLVDGCFADTMAKKYGKDSNVYCVRVLGDFPESSDDVLIPLDWLTSAVDRDIATDTATRIAGLDVARFGDDASAIVIRQGKMVVHVDQWRGKDLMQTVGKVAAMFRDRDPKTRFDRVHVDSIGMGAGVEDRLAEIGVPVMGVNVAETSAGLEKFARLRDELWWKAREWFGKKDVRIDPKCSTGGEDLMQQMIGELSSAKYTYTSSGKVKAEGKDERKKRGLESPNIADALCLTFAEGRAASRTKANLPKPEAISYLY